MKSQIDMKTFKEKCLFTSTPVKERLFAHWVVFNSRIWGGCLWRILTDKTILTKDRIFCGTQFVVNRKTWILTIRQILCSQNSNWCTTPSDWDLLCFHEGKFTRFSGRRPHFFTYTDSILSANFYKNCATNSIDSWNFTKAYFHNYQ